MVVVGMEAMVIMMVVVRMVFEDGSDSGNIRGSQDRSDDGNRDGSILDGSEDSWRRSHKLLLQIRQ